MTPDLSELLFEASGQTTSPIAAGSAAVLRNQSWKVTVPASVLQTGIGLGLLKPGDTPSGTASVTVSASNTREGTKTADGIPLSIGPLEVDPSGNALPATTSFAVPDMSFTATGGPVQFAMHSTTVEVVLGPIGVTFTCEPIPPIATIATATVQGAATAVAGTSVTRPASRVLAVTGPSAAVKILLALALVDLGYILYSATRPARRRAG